MERTKIQKKLTININRKTYDVKVSISSKTATSTSLSVEIDQKIFDIIVSEPKVLKLPRARKPLTLDETKPVSEHAVHPVEDSAADLSSNALIRSPMPAKVLSVNVGVGDRVQEGDVILVLESMKMENEIYAPRAGTIIDVRASAGMSVNIDDLLLIIS